MTSQNVDEVRKINNIVTSYCDVIFKAIKRESRGIMTSFYDVIEYDVIKTKNAKNAKDLTSWMASFPPPKTPLSQQFPLVCWSRCMEWFREKIAKNAGGLTSWMASFPPPKTPLFQHFPLVCWNRCLEWFRVFISTF